ncbi:uncharacterized protein Bfra_002095 [Botrytis fragariae]|uniref:Uncharacterized protein n=1 Tax=Botrytis fragariae TaxID=1964551 RepID=A0A8H6EMF7_9HELO|nr:uncharacterized protein Bfra_002095 [Botrytis fragariae]KAF5877726.1 hypothetical protein Bfra_002095 [Botrytis fragariae]
MHSKTLVLTSLFLSLAATAALPTTAIISESQLNLWNDSACSVPYEEITLPTDGTCTNLPLPGAQSVSAAITVPGCISTIYGFTSFDCGGDSIVVSSPIWTGCLFEGNHWFLSFRVEISCTVE